jgi:hypothetical protein
LYSGSIGAYLESSTRQLDRIQNQQQLCACRDWLIQHNPLFARYTQSQKQISPTDRRPLPSIEPSNADKPRPVNWPDLLLNPIPYHPETKDKDFHHTRLPGASLANNPDRWIGKNKSILEPLLFPWLYPYETGHWQLPTAGEFERLYQDALGRDIKARLNSVVSHFRDDHYWPAWSYMRLEERRIF